LFIIEFVTLLLFLADDVAKRNTEEEEDHVAPLVKNVVVVVVVAVYSFSFSVSLSSRSFSFVKKSRERYECAVAFFL
jgi:NADH:ubiquinone oxidoreductase subunit 3 (subunit A)